MKNAFVIVTLSGLLSACAVAPQQHPATPKTAATKQPEAEAGARATETAGAEKSDDDERLPKVQLTSIMLYQLMKAEFEFRKGEWQAAYLTMLSLAQQTRDPRLARRAAEMAVAAKQPDDALAAIRLWRQLDPASDEATQYYVGMVVLSDNIADLEDIFRSRLQQATPATRGLLMFQIQQLLGRAKDRVAASAMLARVIAPYGDTMEAHVVQAQAAFAGDDKVTALREAQAALALKPDSEIAMLMLVQVMQDEAKAAGMLEDFVKAHPNAREVRTAYGRILVNRKQYGAARAQFEILLKDQPDNATALYALGILSAQSNDAPAAEKYFLRFVEVLDRDPDDERDPSKALLILSQLAEERGDLKGALQWLDKIPANAEAETAFSARLRRAQLLGKQGDVAGARRLLAAMKPPEPAQQAQVVMAESQLLREFGRLEEAYALMAAGAKRFPANPDLLYDFALLAERTGRLDVMEKTLRDVMAQAPDNHHAYNALGYSLAERNVRLKEAYELIGKAMKIAPNDPFIMDSMGWVQYRMGNLDQAEAHLRRAYALRHDPEIAVHLGEVLWKKGQKDEAQQLWREARAKDPRNDTLRSTLARLGLVL